MQKKRFENMVFCIDFDGTCVKHDFPRIGNDVPGAVDTLKFIVENGGKLILHTMRSGDYLEVAVLWFRARGIELWAANINPTQAKWTSSPKTYAHVYIDDAALGCPLGSDTDAECQPVGRPFVNWGAVKDLYLINEFYIEEIHPAKPAPAITE